MNRLAFGFLFFLLWANFSYAVRYEVAAQSYADGSFELALRQFKNLAKLGNKDAQFQIGVMYLRGEGVEKNHAVSYAWFKLSASKGNPSYKETLSSFSEKASEALLAEGRSEFDKLIQEYGDELIDKWVHIDYEEKDAGEFKSPRPLRKLPPKYPRKALTNYIMGNAIISFNIGVDGRTKNHQVVSYTDEVFLEPSIEAVRRFVYRPAMVNGKPVESYGLTNRFLFNLEGGEVLSEQIEEYLVELQRKAESGGSVERYNYAIQYHALMSYIGENPESLEGRPSDWFLKSAVDGLSHAQYELGRTVLHGERCNTNIDQGYFWLNQAAKQGLPDAQLLLGVERFKGARFEKDEEMGLVLLEKAAEAGWDPAKVEYAALVVTKGENAQLFLKKASAYLEAVDKRKFKDRYSYLEAVMLVAVASGENSKQVDKARRELLREAKKLNYSQQRVEENIERVLQGKQRLPLIEG